MSYADFKRQCDATHGGMCDPVEPRWQIPCTRKGQTVWAQVDEEDFEFLSQWKWRWTKDRRGKKFYAVRNQTRRAAGKRVQRDQYMHKLVLERAGKIPATSAHVIGDHQNGDSLDNRRINLEWATRSENVHSAKARTNRCPHSGQFQNGVTRKENL